jgi:hypothetical protein
MELEEGPLAKGLPELIQTLVQLRYVQMRDQVVHSDLSTGLVRCTPEKFIQVIFTGTLEEKSILGPDAVIVEEGSKYPLLQRICMESLIRTLDSDSMFSTSCVAVNWNDDGIALIKRPLSQKEEEEQDGVDKDGGDEDVNLTELSGPITIDTYSFAECARALMRPIYMMRLKQRMARDEVFTFSELNVYDLNFLPSF